LTRWSSSLSRCSSLPATGGAGAGGSFGAVAGPAFAAGRDADGRVLRVLFLIR
jgi:hypothetical protein